MHTVLALVCVHVDVCTCMMLAWLEEVEAERLAPAPGRREGAAVGRVRSERCLHAEAVPVCTCSWPAGAAVCRGLHVPSWPAQIHSSTTAAA